MFHSNVTNNHCHFILAWILFLILLPKTSFPQTINLTTSERDSGYIFLLTNEWLNSGQYIKNHWDSSFFRCERLEFADSIIYNFNQQGVMYGMTLSSSRPGFSNYNFVFNKTDSSLSWKNKKLVYIGESIDTVRNIKALKYFYDDLYSDDEECTIYFIPEIGPLYFLSYWWTYCKYDYIYQRVNGYKVLDIDFHEYEKMIKNFLKK